ncbi:MAG: metallophosphoesterase [Planctomycetota bacterium]
MTTANTDTPGRPARRKPVFLITVTVLALAAVGTSAISKRARPTLIAGPMVQIPAPDTLTIVWDVEALFATGKVCLTGPDGMELVKTATAQGTRCEVSFDGLKPGGEYTYTVSHSGFLWRDVQLAGPHETAAPPPRGTPFRFIAFGDSGVGGNAQAALGELVVEHNPDLFIHLGDLDQSTGLAKNYLPYFFEPYAVLLRSVPFLSVLGNHDSATDAGKALLDIFVLPRNGPEGIEPERNFYFDFGDARFVGLDTNRVAGKQSGILTPEQMKNVVAPWLRQILTDCDARWKFVYFHHPFYTGSNHPPEGAAYVKEAYVSVFEDCGVDMVFCGHNHLYERSAPILRDKIVEDGRGVVYITSGTGGARRYAMNLPPPPYNRVYNDKLLGFVQVDLTTDKLVLKQINERGDVFDEYVIEK